MRRPPRCSTPRPQKSRRRRGSRAPVRPLCQRAWLVVRSFLVPVRASGAFHASTASLAASRRARALFLTLCCGVALFPIRQLCYSRDSRCFGCKRCTPDTGITPTINWLPPLQMAAWPISISHTSYADVDFVRVGTRPEPSSAALPGPITLPHDRSRQNRTRRRPEPRTHSHSAALTETR